MQIEAREAGERRSSLLLGEILERIEQLELRVGAMARALERNEQHEPLFELLKKERLAQGLDC